ncbi:MAG: thiamine-phosphate pyrophosphorylase [Candidatus Omnitrophica bacterium]|nr:thiamine-phosphate pyrophosphorylase [Candidatus Omnitrophota bacterium]
MGIKREIYRIVDANFNRSREGLRVCEDIARFAANSPALTKELKKVRHGISRIIKSSPDTARMLIESRDACGDVGRKPLARAEVPRKGYADIFTANIERVKESLRVLEEFTKLVYPEGSPVLSRYRFKVYDIEKRAMRKLGQ